MKTILLLVLVLGLSSVLVADVDLIVQSHEDWRDGKPTSDWTKKDFVEFWRQTHKGEIIAVQPVRESHGSEVHPPTFVVITVTGVTVKQAKSYLAGLVDSTAGVDTDSSRVKQRRYHFTRRVVDSALTLWGVDSSRIIMTKAQARNLLVEYNVSAIKRKIRDRLQR